MLRFNLRKVISRSSFTFAVFFFSSFISLLDKLKKFLFFFGSLFSDELFSFSFEVFIIMSLFSSLFSFFCSSIISFLASSFISSFGLSLFHFLLLLLFHFEDFLLFHFLPLLLFRFWFRYYYYHLFFLNLFHFLCSPDFLPYFDFPGFQLCYYLFYSLQ